MYEIGRQNKMKRKTGISLMMALLMVVSSLAAVIPSTIACECYKGKVDFTKTVWDKDTEEWVDETTAIIGETVRFNITIAYDMDDYYNDDPLRLYDINITDELPPCLEYIDGSATITPTKIDEENNTIYWNLTDALYDEESLTIFFDAVVIVSDETVNTNVAYMIAVECGIYNHDGDDTATVYVRDELVVEKEVWDGNEWAENVDYVILNQTLRFRITITYYGPDTLDWMKVIDCLPTCCLNYTDNVVITGAPDVEPTVDDGCIEWEWTQGLEIENGDTVTIEFDAQVINYCYQKVCNSVKALAKELCDGDLYYGYNETTCINCVPPDPILEKKVIDGNTWAEETDTFVGDTVTFKIELTYYGSSSLKDIEIVDELPCCLIYADNVRIEIKRGDYVRIEPVNFSVDISEDNRTITWNIEEDELEDGETLSIEFDALVVDITSACGCNGINTAMYTASTGEYEGSDTATVKSSEKAPVDLGIKIGIGIGHVCARIINVGDADVSDIEWTISVYGRRIDVSSAGTIETLEEGHSEPIFTPPKSIVRRFGRVKIFVTATVGEDTFEKTACGFVWGRLIIVRQTWI